MSTWRIWYTDGYIDGSTQEEWNAAPYDNVQGVAEFFGYDKHGTKLGACHQGDDWYWMDNGVISSGPPATNELDEPDIWLPHNAPETAVLKRGRYTTQERINEVDQQVREWIS